MPRIYEPYEPPAVFSIDRSIWTLAQAREYAAWVESSVETRAKFIVDFLEVDPELEPVALLEDAQERVQVILEGPEFSRWSYEKAIPPIREKALTFAGEALSVDLGFLLASLLLRHLPGVFCWKIVRKPRLDMNYNLPVLEHKVEGEPHVINPLHFAFAKCLAALEDSRYVHGLAEVFRYLQDLHSEV